MTVFHKELYLVRLHFFQLASKDFQSLSPKRNRKSSRSIREHQKGVKEIWSDGGTYDIAESDDVQESGGAFGGGWWGLIDIFIGKDSSRLPHRFGKLCQFFDCLHFSSIPKTKIIRDRSFERDREKTRKEKP